MTEHWSPFGPEGPPPEAYSRVTNAERFRPPHGAAKDLLERLVESYDVERQEGYGIDPDLEARCELTGPIVRLVPRSNTAAPFVLAFTAFPGVHVRAGRWHIVSFPHCGCDACAETAQEGIDALASLAEDVTAGRMREAIAVDPSGAWWEVHELWSAHHRSSGRTRIDEDRARDLLAAGKQSSVDWQPWPQRKAASR